MFKHPAWKEFEKECQKEERRIDQITDPDERDRQFEHFEQWVAEETENINMLINHEEATVADRYEESLYV